MTQQKKILLTGTTGFLGSHIREHLKKQEGWRIYEVLGRKAFDDFESYHGLSPDVIIHAGFTVDFNPAGDETSESVINTQKLIDYAVKNKVRHLVFLSAAGTLGVGKTNRARDEEDFCRTDPDFADYLNTQYIQDKIVCQSLLDRVPLASTTLFLTTVYGPGLQKSVLESLAAVRGLSPVVICPPGGTSFLDLRDFLSALDRVLEQLPRGGFVISSGNTTFTQLYETVMDIYDVAWRKKIIRLPGWVKDLMDLGVVKTLTGGVNPSILKSGFGYKYYSAHKARQVLGWVPKYSLRDALHAILK